MSPRSSRNRSGTPSVPGQLFKDARGPEEPRSPPETLAAARRTPSPCPCRWKAPRESHGPSNVRRRPDRPRVPGEQVLPVLKSYRRKNRVSVPAARRNPARFPLKLSCDPFAELLQAFRALSPYVR